MPQRNSYTGQPGPFGPTLFSTSWSTGRDRATTLSTLNSNNGPSSPAQSSFSKDGMGDNEMRTLDYLGLADTPQQPRASLAPATLETLLEGQRVAAMQPFMADLVGLNKNLNRFRSYSVNAKEKYAEEEDEELGHGAYSTQHSGSLTPSAASAAAALAATQAQIHQHNLAVQAFANQASVRRPRARTAGVLESPPQRSLRNYLATPSRLDNSITAADLRLSDVRDYEGLPEAIHALGLGGLGARPGTENEDNLEGPTRALWLGSIPSSTTVTSLNAIFGTYGKIESARVLTHKNCGFVNYENAESAIQAKSLLNGKEIFPGAGPVRIGYAKVPDSSSAGTPGANGVYPSASPDPFAKGPRDSSVNRHGGSGRESAHDGSQNESTRLGNAAAASIIPQLSEMKSDMLEIVKECGATDEDQVRIGESIDRATSFNDFEPEIPAISEPSHDRIHDAPKLRDIRKRIDNNTCSQGEIEKIAEAMLPEIAILASDYLGNTVVQKLFEYCSDPVKVQMLEKIAPHLAQIGVHKNGTWAAQKIVDVSKTADQRAMIVDSLRPYTVPLFLDQYGNYVLQCALQFGSPWNNFIFEGMLNRLWDIAQGRFGARAMRACLESHVATKDQQRMVAAAIALHSVQLATNTNGALLLTWFLDTCTFPRRRTVLGPRLVPHLVHLCTHKVAYLTVLKVINQRNEPEARNAILDALFFSPEDRVLEEILSDSGCGATLIFKVLTTPFLEEPMRSDVVQKVRSVLVALKAQPAQGYKRLMDEVGLSTRNGGGGGSQSREHQNERDSSVGRSQSRDRTRPGSRQQHGSNGHTPQPGLERQYSGQYFPPVQPIAYDPSTGLSRNSSIDQNLPNYEAYALNAVNPPMFTPNPNLPVSSLTTQQLQSQQLQYQQAVLAASARNLAPAPQYFPGVSAGMTAFPTVATGMDTFRNVQGHSPIPPTNPHLTAPSMMGQQAGYAPPGFNPLVGGQMLGGAGYQYPGMNGMGFMPQQQQQQQPQPQQGGNRRGRVSSPLIITHTTENHTTDFFPISADL